MKRLIRYLKMLYIVCCKGGYARAKLLKKWEYFKSKVRIVSFNLGILDQNRI